MDPKKRIRSINWSEQEKKVLRMLVLERDDIIEKKDTSTNTNNAKKIAWEEVLSHFNAINGIKRDMTQLNNQWRNMKNKAKKSEFAYRRARAMTGGGPPPPSPPSEDRELMDAIPHEFAVDSNCYDSDAIYLIQEESKTKAIPVSQSQNLMESETLQTTRERPGPPSPANKHCQSEGLVFVMPETSQTVSDRPGPSSPANEQYQSEGLPTAMPVTSQTVSPASKIKKKQIKKPKSYCCSPSHEHQLFMLAMRARKEAMQHEKEVHDKRMKILLLEEEYWKIKIKDLK